MTGTGDTLVGWDSGGEAQRLAPWRAAATGVGLWADMEEGG